jgi:hypothetical protein
VHIRQLYPDCRVNFLIFNIFLVLSLSHKTSCRGFVNRSVIGVGVWRFVEGGEYGGAIRDGGSTSLSNFRSRNGGETLCAAIIHYMATSARLQ